MDQNAIISMEYDKKVPSGIGGVLVLSYPALSVSIAKIYNLTTKVAIFDVHLRPVALVCPTQGLEVIFQNFLKVQLKQPANTRILCYI